MELSSKELFNFFFQNGHLFSGLDDNIGKYFAEFEDEPVQCLPCGMKIKKTSNQYEKFLNLARDEEVLKKIIDFSESILQDRIVITDLSVFNNRHEDSQNK